MIIKHRNQLLKIFNNNKGSTNKSNKSDSKDSKGSKDSTEDSSNKDPTILISWEYSMMSLLLESDYIK